MIPTYEEIEAIRPAQEGIGLLLYIESCAVDKGALLEPARLNDGDMKRLKEWNNCGFIVCGRVHSSFLQGNRQVDANGNIGVRLSPEAWEYAHRARRERAERAWNRRTWRLVSEINKEADLSFHEERAPEERQDPGYAKDRNLP